MPLKRTLGLAGLTFYGLGIILGAGIYSVIGVAAGEAGAALWISFVVSGVVSLITALSYAELSTMHPETSAEFAYLRRALPRWPAVALVTGLLVALSGTATSATVAMAFAGYFTSLLEAPPVLVAWGVLLGALALNLVGVQQSAWVNTAFTLVETAGLIVFIVLGATTGAFADVLSAAPTLGVLSGAALVFFSFLGFENVANLAEEAKEPERDLPRAIFLCLGIATVLYVLVALAATALLPGEELASSQAPLADAAAERSQRIAGALGGIALFATANTALVSMLVASRVVFGIARQGEIPRALAALMPKRGTPWAATVLVAALAATLVPFGTVAVVASVSSFASLLAFAGVNVALIVLRYTEPRRRRPFRVPGTIGRFPVLPALGAATTLGVATQLDSGALLGGFVALAVFAAYAFWRQWKGGP
jgi:APA family basic amino acid/polyamine antiporter